MVPGEGALPLRRGNPPQDGMLAGYLWVFEPEDQIKPRLCSGNIYTSARVSTRIHKNPINSLNISKREPTIGRGYAPQA